MCALDCIVIGVGGIGAAVLERLARRGLRVLGIDPLPPGHGFGSSHGATRLIRRAYFEHPDYVPLVERAYQAWADLEERLGRRLLNTCGLLQVGPDGGEVLRGVRRSAREHGLDVRDLSYDDIRAEFPAVRVPASWSGVFEPGAAYLPVEACVVGLASLAVRQGARIHLGERVCHWEATSEGVRVRTQHNTWHAARLIITAGAWAGHLLGERNVSLHVLRKPLYWFDVADGAYDAANGFPAFLFETAGGIFYGFPRIDLDGLKVAQHSGGKPVDDASNLDRTIDSEDLAEVRRFLVSHLPHAGDRVQRHSVCMYTMTADGHFIVDRHPEHPQVTFAAGLSGHGFKFSPVLAEALVDLSIDGQTELPIGFLSCNRPTLGNSRREAP